jgi:endonuclease/exonuclease/phosphatase (EEP) superfamily protein YafD
VGWGVWCYLGLGLLAAALLYGLGDRWWPATLLLFGPRYLLLAPLLILMPAALVWRRPLVMLLVITALIVVFPVMGVRTGWRTWIAGGPRGVPLRIITFNIEAGAVFAPLLPAALEQWRPDVMLFQECDDSLKQAIREASGWHYQVREELCALSRYPILTEVSEEEFNLGDIGSTGAASRYDIQLPGQVIHVVNLHLETPRKGLAPLLSLEGTRRMTNNSFLRDLGSRRIRRWVDSIPAPLLIAGDFNMPVESAIYRQYWGSFANAFDLAGRGVGGSRAEARVGVRIDHVLVGKGWRAVRAWVGPDFGTDHRPMIVDTELLASPK